MKLLIKIAGVMVLLITPLIMFAFYIGLSEKINNPQNKNLSSSDYVYLGIFVLFILTIDVFTIKRLLKKKNKPA